jgi:hypothetical protein
MKYLTASRDQRHIINWSLIHPAPKMNHSAAEAWCVPYATESGTA